MKKGTVARLMGSTVFSQILLSGSNFFVAFFLLRQLGAEPYGYYVLVSAGILLFVTLQGAFFLTPILVILPGAEPQERKEFLGGVMRARHRVMLGLGALIVVGTAAGWGLGLVGTQVAMLTTAGVLAGSTILFREFCRGVLLAHHQGGSVLRGDVLFAALLVGGSVGATLLSHEAFLAVAAIALAGLISAAYFLRALWLYEPWHRHASAHVLRRVSSFGAWSAFGAAVHWSFSQGYTYLVAALLDVRAVAALAATRLLLMPLNLLSSGVNQSMYPLVARWHSAEGLHPAFRRVVKIGSLLVVAGCVYVLLAWLLRDIFFNVILRKSFPDQDQLILMWSVLFILMMVRDQLNCMLVVRSRLRPLSYVTLAGAVVALLIIRLAVPEVGSTGALVGIIVGELINLFGMLVLVNSELKLPVSASLRP